MVRRLMGGSRRTPDIAGHRSTSRRPGGRIEVELPSDWVWPYWLERQLDPASPAFVPRGHAPSLANVTSRNWTAVGNLDAPWEAIVDPRGLVTPWPDGWSLDWWIGADDRWHLPSRDAGVRQRLVDATPVVETAMRIPGGDAIQRAYGVRRPSAEGGGELVIVEIENKSRLPVAVALGVRPYNPEGLAAVERIGLDDDTTVTVDGRVAMLLPKPASRFAASTLRDGDSSRAAISGEAGDTWPGSPHCAGGLAQAAFVYPLAHGAALRVALPVVPEEQARRRGRTPQRVEGRVEGAQAFPSVVPPAEHVANGWVAQSRKGLRFELPDSRLAEAVDANRRFLLLLHDGDEVTPGPATDHRFRFREAASLLAALGNYGMHDEVAQVLASYPDRQQNDGFFLGRRQEWDANGAALWALAHHWRLTRDRDLVEAMVGPIAKGVHWIERRRQSGRGREGRARQADESLRGLLPPGVSAEHLGPDYFYGDDFWGVAGLRAGAELLRGIDQPEAGADAERFAARFWSDLVRSMELTAKRLDTPAIPAGPRRRIDPGIIGSLVACRPLDLMAADDERVAATLDVLRERFTLAEGRAPYQATGGLGTYLTLQLAAVELAAGDRRCLDRLAWLLDAATPTWTWPEAIHPRLPGGCVGDGHNRRAAADFLDFVRTMLVTESSGGGLALSSAVPESWYGQGWEVHDAPTAQGLLSYAVRWHGDRPALLWELQPHTDVSPAAPNGNGRGDDDGVGATTVRLTAPGLDPDWSSTELKGEALLSPVAVPEAVKAEAAAEPVGGSAPSPPAPSPPAPSSGGTPVDFPGGSFS
jgi:hypothetical protein